MAKSSRKKTSAYIAGIIILAMLLVAVGAVAYVTDGFSNWNFGDMRPNTALSGIEVVVNDEPYEGQSLSGAAVVTVEGGTLEAVEILPANNGTFDFRRAGALTKFPYIDGNFNEAFGVTVDGNTIILPSIRSLEVILEKKYLCDITEITAVQDDIAYFVLRMTVDEKVIDIPLDGFYEWMKVSLEPEEITF